MRAVSITPLLLRGRIRAGSGLIDLLGVLAFTISSWLLQLVLGGVNMFVERQHNPPTEFVAALGSSAAQGIAELQVWTLLAACAGVLLIVPVVTLGAAAARMGALGRDQRLATLRLLGLSAGQAVALSTVETMLAALAGGVLGTAGYLLTLPLWSGVTFQATPLSAAAMLLPAWAIAATIAGLVVLAGLSSVTGLMRLRISPLGVARREPRPALRLWRFAALPVVIVLWLAVAPALSLTRSFVYSATLIVIVLAMFMGVINLIGPWLLQAAGRDARALRPPVGAAGRTPTAGRRQGRVAQRVGPGLRRLHRRSNGQPARLQCAFGRSAVTDSHRRSAYRNVPHPRHRVRGGCRLRAAQSGGGVARSPARTAPVGQPRRARRAARPHPAGRGDRARRPECRWARAAWRCCSSPNCPGWAPTRPGRGCSPAPWCWGWRWSGSPARRVVRWCAGR